MPPNSNDHNQQPNNPQAYSGAWDFLNTPDQPPKQPSFFSRYKKLIIIASVSLFILVGLSALSFVFAPQSEESAVNVESSATTVELKDYQGAELTFKYPANLRINLDEAVEEPKGYFVQLAEDSEISTYDVAVQTMQGDSPYTSGEEAVTELLELGEEAKNPVTTDVEMAGGTTKKTIAEFIDSAGTEKYVVYAAIKNGDRTVMATAMYPRNQTEITDSFNALIASISLK